MRTSSSTYPDQPSKKRCCLCSCPVLFVIFLLMVIGGGIILWQFLPDSTKEGVRGRLPGGGGNSTGSEGDGGGLNVPLPTFVTSGGGEEPPAATFDFYAYCDDKASCCNGMESLCGMPINKIMYAGLHNAGSTIADGFYLAGNHDYQLEDAIDRGYRVVNLDFGLCDGELAIIHGSCRWGSRDPLEVFTNIRTFLEENPREILLMPAEIVEADDGNNEGGLLKPSLDQISEVMAEASITKYMYWHNLTTTWPTLEELIDKDQRLFFSFYNGDSCREIECPEDFQEWFLYATETPFEFDDTTSILSYPKVSCAPDRGLNKQFYAINMFVSNPLPSKNAAKVLNTKANLQEHMVECEKVTNLTANVLFIDFWSVGDTVQVVQIENRARGEAWRRLLLESGEEEGRQQDRRLRSPSSWQWPWVSQAYHQ